MKKLPQEPNRAWSLQVDKVPAVAEALRRLETGDFQLAAALERQAFGDDRVGAALRTRCNGLVGKKLEIVETRDTSPEIIAALEQDLADIWPDTEAFALARRGLMMTAAPAVLDVDVSGARAVPRLVHWDAGLLRYNWGLRQYQIQTRYGLVDLPTDPDGDGLWLLHEPFGRRAWQDRDGLLVAICDTAWLARQYAIRDAAGYSEVHGMPWTIAETPLTTPGEDEAGTKAQGDEFLDDLRNAGSNRVLRCPTQIDPITNQRTGYNVRLVEATAKTHEVFFSIQDRASDSIAVTVLGGNTGTFAQQGSHALAEVQDLIRADLQVFDAAAEARTLNVVIRWWALWNFGAKAMAPTVRRVIPADVMARAARYRAIGESTKALRDGGISVDTTRIAREAGVPLQQQEEAT